MCETYDAIYEIKDYSKKSKVTLWVDKVKITGTIAECDCGCDGKCLKGVITLKDVTTHCKECKEEMHLDWLNVSSKWIKAFVFHMD